MKISLPVLGTVLAGSILAWAAIKGQSVGDTVRALIGGKEPITPQTTPIVSEAADASNSDGGSSNFPVPETGNNNKNIGRLLAAPYGWATGPQWNALETLWDRESNWNNKAKNPSSGAYGIPQALPPTKMPKAAQESGGSSATAQIQWGLAYIKNRYGNPINAWGFWQSHNWY
jgi:resuscitation-promoting factor RpfB